MRRLFVSDSSRARLGALNAWLDGLDARRSIVLVGPNRSAMGEFIRARATVAGPSIGLDRSTPLEAAYQMARPALLASRRPGVPLTEPALEAYCAGVAHDLCAEGQLEYFEPIATSAGFPRCLRRTLHDLAFHRVDAEMGSDAPASCRDLARLEARYREGLVRNGWLDPAAIVHAALEALGTPALDARPLPALALVHVDLSEPLWRAFYEAWWTRTDEALALAPPGDRRVFLDLLRPDDETIGASASAAASAGSATTGGAPGAVENLLMPAAAACTVTRHPTPVEECEAIAAQIVGLAESGLSFECVAVGLLNPTVYTPLLEEALREADVPFFLERSIAQPWPEGRAFVALLRCALEGLSAERFAEYLSFGVHPGHPVSEDAIRAWCPAANPDQLPFFAESSALGAENTQRDKPAESAVPPEWNRLLGMHGGPQSFGLWQSRIRDAIGRRLLGLAAGDIDSVHEKRLRLELGQLRWLERFALPIIERLAKFPRADQWGAWLSMLQELASRSLRAPEALQARLGMLNTLGNGGQVSLEILSLRLSDFLSDRWGSAIAAERYGAVLVASPQQFSDRSFHTVFLPGVNDGAFPAPDRPDPLLLDDIKVAHLPALPRRDERIAREARRLRWVAQSVEYQLMCSYSEQAFDRGRALVPAACLADVPFAAAEEQARPARPENAVSYEAFCRATVASALEASQPGILRFCIDASDFLAAGLRRHAVRWRAAWADDAALFGEEAARPGLGAGRRVQSPTSLQTYIRCPYAYFLRYVAEVFVPDRPLPPEGLDPRRRGELYHAVAYETVRRLIQQSLVPIRSDTIETAQIILGEVLETTTSEWRARLGPPYPALWARHIEDIRADIGAVLESQMNSEWVPVAVEQTFGTKESVSLGSCEQPVRGAIDLVQRSEKSGAYRIVDYKTGRAPRRSEWPRPVAGGRLLQPALYAAVLARQGHPVQEGVLYFATRDQQFCEVVVPWSERTEVALDQILVGVAQGTARGWYPAAPAPDACGHCDYRRVCGPHEATRAEAKQQPPIAELVALRSMK